MTRTAHTLVPLVWELGRVVGEPHGGWVHWGATTQNITQTGETKLEMVTLTVHTPAFRDLVGQKIRVPVGAFVANGAIMYYSLRNEAQPLSA